ncbi:hypothetical protein BC832DRAFT_601037 [Gaertneriomyces semiglobifer]|nr:hypothetical protein BC832DRAFT_601037 [Gaertneriomyces semiglobifer]
MRRNEHLDHIQTLRTEARRLLKGLQKARRDPGGDDGTAPVVDFELPLPNITIRSRPHTATHRPYSPTKSVRSDTRRIRESPGKSSRAASSPRKRSPTRRSWIPPGIELGPSTPDEHPQPTVRARLRDEYEKHERAARDALSHDNQWYEDLQDFRSLYKNAFMHDSYPIVSVVGRKQREESPDLPPALSRQDRETYYYSGSFRVNKRLQLEKVETVLVNTGLPGADTDSPVKVSIPKAVQSSQPLTYSSHRRSSFDPQGSFNIGD